jgi:L,D-transpeptidase YcbB
MAKGRIMFAPWQVAGRTVSALALFVSVASLAARAEDAGPGPGVALPAQVAMSPAHGDPFAKASPEPQNDDQSDAATVPEEAAPQTGEVAPMPPESLPEGKDAVVAPSGGDSEQAPPQGTAMPAVNAALKVELETRSAARSAILSRRDREAIAAFYAMRDFAPLWSRDSKANSEVAPVLERLAHAGDDGLDLKGAAIGFSPSGMDAEVAAADIALTDAVVAYGRQASGSRIDPGTVSRLIGLEPEVADPAIILATVATAGENAGDQLRSFNPPQKPYEALREKLVQMRKGRNIAEGGAVIPAGPVLRPGMRDPRVPLIRARLSLDGGSDAQDKARDRIYDTAVAAAVADFQKANGLPPSGTLTTKTVAVMGGQPSHQEPEIIANMERWRWMPRDMGESRIEVNIPNYEVVVVEKGAVVERHRVIVGKEQTPTPIFSNRMQFLIVNPYWNVPPSIIKKEMLPKLASDPNYLHRLGYEVFSRGGRLVVRQPPGERNALGRIKFMFPNDFAVYLHDTPSRKLFSSPKRAFSHGCVRVDDPFRFAETVLGRGNGWSEQRVKKLIGGKERYVHLPKPLPIHLEYFTAFVDEAGHLQLRDDIYGYSHKVKAALGLEG